MQKRIDRGAEMQNAPRVLLRVYQICVSFSIWLTYLIPPYAKRIAQEKLKREKDLIDYC